MVSDTIILLKSKCIYIYKSKKNNLIKIDVLFWIKKTIIKQKVMEINYLLLLYGKLGIMLLIVTSNFCG